MDTMTNNDKLQALLAMPEWQSYSDVTNPAGLHPLGITPVWCNPDDGTIDLLHRGMDNDTPGVMMFAVLTLITTPAGQRDAIRGLLLPPKTLPLDNSSRYAWVGDRGHIIKPDDHIMTAFPNGLSITDREYLSKKIITESAAWWCFAQLITQKHDKSPNQPNVI